MKISVWEEDDATYLVKDYTRRGGNKDRISEVTFHDLCVDPVTCKAWRSEKEIKLSEKEARMLEYFMLHPNEILSRDMIADYVWGAELKKNTNIVDVYINYLRKKIDYGADSKLIHTVFRQGYIMKNEL
ncbi:winged helix-turn-helix domain-containing protein [Geobacter sp. DSM 9736]|uniref:winged helix-turn-helix domain-containing protein n=1 Tax=Geobacter sp. DSM 9736 TaxID=1277350 RepID=UPI000B4FF7C6|nr:winged helix-turn-helix domain-containing protein [Geobacter sp. DSM 9736]SNB46167.1 Transcriptional regulatory protein, C terminal [Geobacter sp. DSM 9736]